MKNVLRLRALWLLASTFVLTAAPVRAGLFEDVSQMQARFPRVERDSREDEILVKFRANVPPVQRDGKHGSEGNVKLRELGGTGVHHVRTAPSRTVDESAARYRADNVVEYAEPNYVVQAMAMPNEPAFNLLWGLNNTGQTLGTPGADIRAPLAWDRTTGSASVVVMVIDTGIDYTHPDLAANMWVNPGEIPGNGIDDDGNGYIDDVHGIDVVNGDSDPMDDHGHGTHVAGTIGAVGNNGGGVAGVAWNVKLVACKFLDSAGNGSVDRAIECLEYARALKAQGVNIVATNNSWGGLGAASQALREAIDAQREILFIAAAGNFGLDNDTADFYPADYDLPNVVSVAATDHNDELPSFSDWGRRSVHLGAPGVNIFSTVPLGNYASASGTSMAAPHATGVAALLKAQSGTRDWRTIRNLTLAGGDANASLAGKTISGRRLNAANAVDCANRRLFTVRGLPAAFTVDTPSTVSVLSIDCGNPVGPVTGTSSAGETFTLSDDGVAPDVAAGDGEFTATWTPGQSFAYVDFTSAAGSERISVLDLAVTSVAGPSAANRGDTVAIAVTVANPSSTSAPASTLNLVLSPDGVIGASDLLLGSLATPPLAAGAQQTLAAEVTIPSTLGTGTYFVGALVDPANLLDEGSETNNALAGNAIVIGNLSIDLVVAGVSGPSSAFTGDPITITGTVTNLGTSSASSSTVNFYLSSDAVIDTSDVLIGSAALAPLAGGASQQAVGTVPVPVTLPPGTWYLGAIADAGGTVTETSETNNAAAGGTLTTTTRSIDLAVTAASGSSSVRDGAPISLSATVRNYGKTTAPVSTLRWYLSADDTITAADTLLASVSTPSLAAGKSGKVSASAELPASVAAGSYTIGAIVDPDNTLAETSDANNAYAGGSTTVSYSVDLVMTAVAGPAEAATGQNVTFTGTLKNQGRGATSGNVTVAFYVSGDATIMANDSLIATATVPPLAGGDSVAVTATAALRTSLTAGVYTVGAIADHAGLVPESDEANNALAGGTVAVRYGPDLVLTAVAGPASADRGQTVTLTGTVLNQGIGAVGSITDQDVLANGSPVRIGWYLSNNPTITASDKQLASYTITSLAPGQSIPMTVSATIPNNIPPGNWYIGAIADFSNAVRESSEVNNAFSGNSIQLK